MLCYYVLVTCVSVTCYLRFNAAVPILITMLVTLIGMVLDGWQVILGMPEGERYVGTGHLNLEL